MIFFVYYLAALVLVAAEMRGLLRSQVIATPKFSGTVWVLILVVSYALEVAICGFLAKSGPWPFAVVQWREGGAVFIAGLLAIGLLQSYALLGLYRTRTWPSGIEIGAAMMLLISFAPVLSNADVYAYAGDALLGRAAYAPPAIPFSGDLGAINVFWHAPMPPTTYGPLWLAVAHAVTEPFGTLVLKLYALRGLGAVLFGAFLLLLRGFGVSPRLLAVVAVNPALYFEFVLNAHNDLLPASVCVAAAIVAAALPWLAALLIAIAALVKAPFALLGLPVLARVKSPALRWMCVALSVAAALAASWYAGRMPYVRALEQHASSSGLETWLHVVAIVAAIGAVFAAIWGAHRLRSAVWLLPLIGAYTAPWYALWSVPYAVGERRVLAYLAIWFPFVAVLVEPSFARLWTVAVVVPAAVILSLKLSRSERQLQGGPS